MRKISIAFMCVAWLGLAACQNSTNTDGSDKPDAQLDRGKASLIDAPIVRVGATFIYQSDIDRLAVERQLLLEGDSLVSRHPQFQTLLKELINQRLLAAEAIQISVDQSSENKRRLAAARERVLSNILTETVLREAVTDETILRLYNEQAALANRGNEVRARHILVGSQKKAEMILKSLEAGENFGDLALIHSEDAASKDRGGDLGWITRDRLATDLTQVLFNTKTDERTEVFKTNAGWHIAEVMQRRAPPGQDLEAVRPKIRSFLTYEALDNLINRLRDKTEIEILIEPDAAASDPQKAPESQNEGVINQDENIETSDG